MFIEPKRKFLAGLGGLPGSLAGGIVDEAAEIAEAIGGKLALKVQSPDILHKTEAGAVALDQQQGNAAHAFATAAQATLSAITATAAAISASPSVATQAHWPQSHSNFASQCSVMM